MKKIIVHLPDSLQNMLRKLAARDNISINQFISMAVAEKDSALATKTYLEDRAKRADKQKFNKVLAKVAKRPLLAGDSL